MHNPHGVRNAARLQHPATRCRPDDLVADPGVHLALEHVEPYIVFMDVWREEEAGAESLLDDRDGPIVSSP